jgi:hypothetical protein
MSTDSPSERQHDGISLLSLTLFTGICYGTVLTIYIQCLFSLGSMRQAPGRRLFFLGYTSAMFILGTLYTAANSRRVWITFILNWGSPTKPVSYEIGLWHDWASMAAMACYILSNWLADALMVRPSVLYMLVYILASCLSLAGALYNSVPKHEKHEMAYPYPMQRVPCRYWYLQQYKALTPKLLIIHW